MTFTDDERETILDHLYVVFHARPIELCGCGDPEAGVRLLVDTLRLHEAEGTIYDRVDAVLGPNVGVQQVILSLLESAGLTDHGSSLRGMHLTAKGRWVLWAVDRLGGVDALPDLCGVGENIGYPHNGEACTDACWQIPARAKR